MGDESSASGPLQRGSTPTGAAERTAGTGRSVRALVTVADGDGRRSDVATLDESELGVGDVTVRVEWSSVNFKDGAALHRNSVMQRLPLVGGIDLAGVVETSDDPRFAPGDRVVATGWDLSHGHHGGWAELARVPGDWLVQVPSPLTTRQAMAIGTAGLTAMLSILALERSGALEGGGTSAVGSRHEVLVTGAGGGVGSIAVALLSGLGHRVVASTGRPAEAPYLASLGARAVIDRSELSGPAPRLGEERWSAAVDSVGSHTLANAIAHTRYGGAVAACGLAQGPDLPGWVSPFYARAVTLIGIDSVRAPRPVRELAWSRLARDLDPALLESTVTEIELHEVPDVARRVLAGEVRGRTLVRIGDGTAPSGLGAGERCP